MVKATGLGRMTLFVGFLFVLMATACGGPSQEEYDEVSQELAATEGDLLDARAQLLAEQESLKELEGDYDEQQEQSDRVAQVLTDTQSELRDVKGQFEAAQASAVELEAIYDEYEWLLEVSQEYVVELEEVYDEYVWLSDGADLAVSYLELIADLLAYDRTSQPLVVPEGAEITARQLEQIINEEIEAAFYAEIREALGLDLILVLIDEAILALE